MPLPPPPPSPPPSRGHSSCCPANRDHMAPPVVQRSPWGASAEVRQPGCVSASVTPRSGQPNGPASVILKPAPPADPVREYPRAQAAPATVDRGWEHGDQWAGLAGGVRCDATKRACVAMSTLARMRSERRCRRAPLAIASFKTTSEVSSLKLSLRVRWHRHGNVDRMTGSAGASSTRTGPGSK